MKRYFSLLLMFFSSSVFAQDSVIGSWQGTQLQNNLPVVINIDIKTLELKDRSTKLVYGMPRDCQVEFEYSGASKNEHVFYFTTTKSFTWCASNVKPSGGKYSHMKIKLTDRGDITYEIFKDGSRLEGGIAQRKK